MSLQNQPLPAFNAVAKNQEASVIIPGGRVVHMIWLEISDDTGVTLASGNLIGDVVVLLGNAEQRRVSGVQLNHINGVNDADLIAKTYGQANQAGYQTVLPICFADPSRKNSYQTRASAIPLNGLYSSMQIKVKMGPNLVNPVLTGFYEFEESDALFTDQTMIVKYRRESIGAVGSIVEKPKLDIKPQYLQAVHLFPTADGKYVNKFRFTKDGRRYRDEMTYQRNQIMLIGRGLNPDVNATPVYDAIFDYDDPVDQWLDLTRGYADLGFKADLNAAAANNMDVVYVTSGKPE